MTFYMNYHEWKIVCLPNDAIKEMFEKYKNEKYEYVYGYTDYAIQTVYLNKDTHQERLYNTLYHELIHVYICEYCSWNSNINEEVLCDYSANSHDIIHEIVKKFKKYNERE